MCRVPLLFGLFCLMMGAGTLADDAGRADVPAKALAWLDKAGEAATKIHNPNDTIESAYDRADVLYQLVIEEAAAGRADRALAHLGALRAAVFVITVGEGDNWAHAYLPGPLIATDQAGDAAVTLSILQDDAARLDALQMKVEVLAITGDAAAYAKELDDIFALLPKVQEHLIAEAAKDAEWDFDGIHTGWFLFNTFRDHGDLINTRRFAGFDWKDPAEAAGAAAILAQLELWKGDADKARAAAEKSARLLASALARAGQRPDSYFPDLDTHLPELVAVRWVLDGKDAALKLGTELAQAETIWQEAAHVHAATLLRRLGKADEAGAALDAALALPFEVGQEPMNWDVMHLCRELARQGRVEDAAKYLGKSEAMQFKAFGSLGVAQGLLRPDAAQ